MNKNDIPFDIRPITEEIRAEEPVPQVEMPSTAEIEGEPTSGDAEAIAETGEADAQKGRKKKKRHRKTHHGKGSESSREAGDGERRSSLRAFLTDDDLNFSFSMLRGLLDGGSLASFVRHNWAFITLLLFFSVVNIGLGYKMRELLIENDMLAKEVLDRRYKALTCSSELRERTLGSKIERELKDSTLRSSTERPFTLNVPADSSSSSPLLSE